MAPGVEKTPLQLLSYPAGSISVNRFLFEKRIIFVLLFISGAVGLVYEVLWLKESLVAAIGLH
jgi:hypothetical protein